MKVMCISGAEGLLKEGDIYTVVYVTENGNYLLEEVEVPEPYTSFDSKRFVTVEDTSDDLTEEIEEEFWAEQPTS